MFSDQKQVSLQKDRAGGVPGRVVLKKKDTPLASLVTFLESTDKRLLDNGNQSLAQERKHWQQTPHLQHWKPEDFWDTATHHGLGSLSRHRTVLLKK